MKIRRGTYDHWLEAIRARGAAFAEAVRPAIREPASPPYGPAIDMDHPVYIAAAAKYPPHGRPPIPQAQLEQAIEAAGCGCSPRSPGRRMTRQQFAAEARRLAKQYAAAGQPEKARAAYIVAQEADARRLDDLLKHLPEAPSE